MYAVIHEHNSESLKDMPHKEHIAGVNACSIHEYNSVGCDVVVVNPWLLHTGRS